MQEQGLSPGQRELEEALKTLRPADGRIDPVGAAFGAGKALARRQVHLWQSITGLFLLVAAGTWMLPAHHVDVSPSNQFHGGALALEPQAAHPQTWSSQSVLMLQESMWKNGMDDFPSTQLPDVKPMHADAPL
jgi:hypothetical protein